MIEPILWLKDTLWCLSVNDINHNTFAAGGREGFHCHVSFNVPSKWDGSQEIMEITVLGTVALNAITAKRNVVRQRLNELGIHGYIIHDSRTFGLQV